MGYGFRIKKTWDRAPAELVGQFRDIPVANVSDCMARMDASTSDLVPMHRDGTMAGPALTVRSRPGDNLMLHKALDMAEPGDVIVCDGGGDTTNALFGELMLTYAIQKGIAGLAINGAIRDRDAFLAHDLPVYAIGVTHRGPYKDGPGEIGYPMTFCGMVVRPGDLILGDGDGIVAVPPADADEILAAAQKKQKAEAGQMEAFKNGTADRAWVDETLKANGCEIAD